MSHRLVLLIDCDSGDDLQKCKDALEGLNDVFEEYGTQLRMCGPVHVIRAKNIQAIADEMFGLGESEATHAD